MFYPLDGLVSVIHTEGAGFATLTRPRPTTIGSLGNRGPPRRLLKRTMGLSIRSIHIPHSTVGTFYSVFSRRYFFGNFSMVLVLILLDI